MSEPELHDYYVSLTRGLLGYYLHFRADSLLTVRKYLFKTYFNKDADCWTLPWCSIYTLEQMKENVGPFIPIERTHSPLYEWQFKVIEE